MPDETIDLSSLEKISDFVVPIAKEKAKDLLGALADVGQDALKQGAESLALIAEIGQLRLTGAISETAAKTAMDNAVASLALVEARIELQAKKAAYKAVLSSLDQVKSVALALLKIGLEAGAGAINPALPAVLGKVFSALSPSA